MGATLEYQPADPAPAEWCLSIMRHPTEEHITRTDRGGTFCDAIAQIPGRDAPVVFKLLSEDPRNYADAPTEVIRRVLELAEGREIPRGELLDATAIESVRIGTTVATNALLEGKGERFALLITRGFKDVCELGDQSRPRLFDLNIRKPKVLFSRVVEVTERVTPEDYDLNPYKKTAPPPDVDGDPALVRTVSGEVVRILQSLDIEDTRAQLQELYADGYRSVAICFMHSHIFPDHERQAAVLAREVGFEYVSISSEVSPTIKILRRATSVCADAYLSPHIKRYIGGFLGGFKVRPKRVDFMQSDGGLTTAEKFGGNPALLSGPAGGVVGISRACYDEEEGTALIGFDMGGTSTDVSRFDGKFEHIFNTTIAGRPISAPMLDISTVAAGGGSILFWRNGLFVVGPESAGAHPGPACYRKGGPLTITDANLFLGRLVPSAFPPIFGRNADEPLDLDIVVEKFHELTQTVNRESGMKMTPEEVASGFIRLANETMVRPIRNITEFRGFNKHHLVSFGGAGGQHACAIASSLGISRVIIHKYSSILSAYGIALAETVSELSEPCSLTFSLSQLSRLQSRVSILKAKVLSELRSQDVHASTIVFDVYLCMRYQGTDTSLHILEPADQDFGRSFVDAHRREFAFSLEREIVVDSIRVRGTGKQAEDPALVSPAKALERAKAAPLPPPGATKQSVFLGNSWAGIAAFQLEDVAADTRIPGPALILDKTQTLLVERSFQAYVCAQHVILERLSTSSGETPHSSGAATVSVNPIQLSVFAHRFMSIAEQMGHTLQRTSISTSIKERLDFSCAIFARDGSLVANAPHIPVHLGSMQFAIQYQHRLWASRLGPGDVLLTNHPEAGGTHLPDLTVVTPVFFDRQLVFYVASRGHHTDIGGIGITSMVPDSKELWQEGLAVRSRRIVARGVFDEDGVRRAFEDVANRPGCSASRRIGDNISDLKAQISANQRGVEHLRKLCDEFGTDVVHAYMGGIQSNAELAIREFLRETHRKLTLQRKQKEKEKEEKKEEEEKGGDEKEEEGDEQPVVLRAVDWYDDGTPVVLTITIAISSGATASAVFDFAGTGAQTHGNMNSPISITHSAVIYALRCLIDVDMPLNQGCLNPVDIRVPKGCILNPSATVAICGSTIASQRVTDVIFRAFGACAASQGCANSFGWGMGGKDAVTGGVAPGWNYGEALGGGSGAGPRWHGAAGVNVHATNTRSTDAEVVETRTPVVVRRHAINRASGGRGRFRGGDGIVRDIEARVPLTFCILSERRVFAPYGMRGGKPGAVGRNFWIRRRRRREGAEEGKGRGDDGRGEEEGEEVGGVEVVALGGKAVVNVLAGDRVQINTPGGGGWGTPDDEDGSPVPESADAGDAGEWYRPTPPLPL